MRVAVAAGAFGAALLLPACASKLLVEEPDGAVAEGGIEADDADNPSSWFRRFDAGIFDRLAPPSVGDYPPPTPGPCDSIQQCLDIANCDYAAGWCCSGLLVRGVCTCGASLGCLPPQVCCDLPDANAPQCVSGAQACPPGHHPWPQ
ncbi:MAG: hypothetical protein ACREJ3_11665 [Polyangiaceae bacterium]